MEYPAMDDIKKESSTPLYEQIESLLVSRIEGGVYPQGSKILLRLNSVWSSR
jgi:DNA-binding GntR family transcriptional regulator